MTGSMITSHSSLGERVEARHLPHREAELPLLGRRPVLHRPLSLRRLEVCVRNVIERLMRQRAVAANEVTTVRSL